MNSHLLKYANGLVGQYYQTDSNNKLAIYLSWAPTLPTSMDKEANLLATQWFDLIRPDYYWNARSDGFFSPKNCIQTAYDTIQTFRQQIPMISIYEDEEIITPYYDEIVLIGASFGGWIAAAMPKFDEFITEIVLLYPRFAYEDMDMIWQPEESDEEFLRQVLLGYKHIYRFAPDSDPYESIINIGNLNPLLDLTTFQNTKVFVWHGSADDVIWSGRSQAFVEQLRAMNPDGDYHYSEYYGLWHGGICKEASISGRLHRRKQFE